MKLSILAYIIKKVQQGLGIVQDTDTATQAISSGKYVFWKNKFKKASTNIAENDTLSMSNLVDVNGGALNEITEHIATKTYSATFSNASEAGSPGTTNVISRSGNVIHVFFDFTMTGNVNAWTTFVTTNIPVSDASFEKNCGMGLATTDAQSNVQITEYLRALVENGKLCFRPSINLISGKRYRTDVTLILP